MLRNIVNASLARSSLSHNSPQILVTGVRHLYTPEALGLDGYKQAKERGNLQFAGPQMKENFRNRMMEFFKPENTNLVFSDDLKQMINVAENTPEDISLLSHMIERFQSQSSGLRFGSFVFGPVVMRFFYLAQRPQEALALLKNPKTVAMFDQFISYQILMDLLLENKMYSEVYDVFLIAQERSINGNRFPKNCVILVLAALFRMNTPESYAQMKKLLEVAGEAGHVPMRRSLTYAAGLALKQNDSQLTLNILASCKQQNYITVRSLKMLAYNQLGRFEDVLALMRSAIDYDVPAGARKRSFPKNLIETVAASINSSGSKEMQLELTRLQNAIADRGLVDSLTLDEMLELSIEKLEPRERDWDSSKQVDRQAINVSFNRGDRSGNDRFQRSPRPLYRRSGLGDME